MPKIPRKTHKTNMEETASKMHNGIKYHIMQTGVLIASFIILLIITPLIIALDIWENRHVLNQRLPRNHPNNKNTNR